MTNHSLNTREQPISGGILWSSFAKWSTWNSTYVSVATTYACGPVPALTRVNSATDTLLRSHVCPHLYSSIHWFMSSRGKPDSRSYKQDSKRKREDMCLWFCLKNWESHTHRAFSQLFVISAFSAFQFPLLFFLKQLCCHLTFSRTVTQMQSKWSPKNYFSIVTPPTLTCSFPQRLTHF